MPSGWLLTAPGVGARGSARGAPLEAGLAVDTLALAGACRGAGAEVPRKLRATIAPATAATMTGKTVPASSFMPLDLGARGAPRAEAHDP